MIGKIIKTVANQYLRQRSAKQGGPRRLPPTSVGEARNRAVKSAVRTLLGRFNKR